MKGFDWSRELGVLRVLGVVAIVGAWVCIFVFERDANRSWFQDLAFRHPFLVSFTVVFLLMLTIRRDREKPLEERDNEGLIYRIGTVVVLGVAGLLVLVRKLFFGDS